MEAILRDASRADPDTLDDIVNELRTHGGNVRTQTEIDGVIARFRATHADPHGDNERTSTESTEDEQSQDRRQSHR
ncbi:hypothetical protein AB0L82_37445 [Nocardia sp. NPDC052001]|uniref:hypothetical protein n=1 Tax=Nocardia sp. NPDC052001 TaxID=3154853 RepID=UPI00341B3760